MKAVSLALLPFALMLAACDAQAPAAPTPEASDAAQDEEALPADPGFDLPVTPARLTRYIDRIGKEGAVFTAA